MRNFLIIIFGGLVIIIVAIVVAGLFAGGDFSRSRSQNQLNAAEEETGMTTNGRIIPGSLNGPITAKEYAVYDVAGNKFLIEKDSKRAVPIASLSKLVTAIVAGMDFREQDKILITQQMINKYGNSDFRNSETFTVKDLLYPLLMVSSNEAAEAFAQTAGRSKFIAKMNNMAQEIGAYNTYFADPTGLSPMNVSSAVDVAIIMKWIYRNRPELLAIMTTKSMTVRDHTWNNPTVFLNWSSYLGGKNGYIPESGQTGASIFKLSNGKVYIVVVLGSSSRNTDVAKLLNLISK